VIRDPYASLALLILVIAQAIDLLDGFSMQSGLALLLVMIAPFSILGLFLSRGALRTQSGWDRPGAPNEVVVHDRDR